jgi:serine/threonine-protein kinase
MTLAPGSRLGPYEVTDLIGRGGMGEVYRARDHRLERFVAVKILRSQQAEHADAHRRFEQEARAVAALNHPNILALFDIGKQDGIAFVVTELLEGRTLRARMEEGPIPFDETLRFATAIAQGLAAAHAKGVIHRDLKPENLFLTNDGVAKILDFGLARIQVSCGSEDPTLPDGVWNLTASGELVGTACYMSPEQARGEVPDARTDIFSFGCVLYEMLSGRKAFGRDSPAESLAAILHEAPPPLKRTGRPLDLRLEKEVMSGCLAKDRWKRFQTSDDLVAALKALRTTSGHGIRWRGTDFRPTLRAVAVALLLGLIGFGSLGGMYFARWRASQAVQRLVVLPLHNGTGDPALDYMADGLTTELTTELSRNLSPAGRIQVLSHTTSRQYSGPTKSLSRIAQELGVDAVVEGDLLRSEGRFRIVVNLYHKDDRPIWAGELSEGEADLFTLQARVARTIVEKLAPGGTSPSIQVPVNPEAHQAYLRGLYFLANNTADHDSIDAAIGAFDEAVQLDPSFAQAWCSLSEALGINGYLGGRKDDMRRARTTAEKALALDPNLAEAHIALANHQLWADWNWPAAAASIQNGLALNPNSASGHDVLGWYLLIKGQPEEAVREGRKARELEPLCFRRRKFFSRMLLWAQRSAEAQQEAEDGLRWVPDSEVLHYNACWAAFQQGHYQEWLSHVAHLKGTLPKGLPRAHLKGTPPDWIPKAQRAIQQGEQAVHSLILDQARTEGNDWAMAGELAVLGRKVEALDALERALSKPQEFMALILRDPELQSLHDEPRFKAILGKMKLP